MDGDCEYQRGSSIRARAVVVRRLAGRGRVWKRVQRKRVWLHLSGRWPTRLAKGKGY